MSQESLGTLEFCSILNGDDPDAAYQYLKRFVKICRRERVEAILGEEENEYHTDEESDDDEEEDENSDSENRPAKKSKVDSWKQDSKGYNVPFVGTSFHKGPTGKVTKGTWPTGFLQAYLERSPNAIEIIGNDAFSPPNGSFHRNLLRRKDKVGKRKSMKLHNIYIQAVGEIATSSIPIQKLKSFSSDVNGDSDCVDQKLASMIIKDFLQHLITVLNNESSSGASQPILESVFVTLKYLASCSVGIAREIAGEMDTKLKDGVLQKLAFYGIRVKEVLSKPNQNLTKNDAAHKNSMKKMIISFEVQNAFLDFASVMLSYNDSTILSYVTNPGGRENKTKPGFAYLALRCALPYAKKLKDEVSVSDSILDATHASLGRFFSAVRMHLLDANDRETHGSSRLSLSNNALVDFFQDGSLERIIQLSVLAALHDSNSLLRVECDLIIQIAFSDHSKSPFLVHLKFGRSSGRNLNAKVTTQLDKAIQEFLTVNGDMKSRHFILKCFNQTPSLFQSWMKHQPISDPKPSFAFLSTISLMSMMLENGPIVGQEHSKENQMDANSKIANIIPKSLSKNILTKALQSQNAMVVSSSLKLTIDILVRYQRIVKSCSMSENEVKTLVQRLPDLQILLALRSRFDPFNTNSLRNQVSSSEVIAIHLCETIELYSIINPVFVRDLQYDWIKFLPDFKSFFQVSRCLQYKILKCLFRVFHCLGSSYCNTMIGSKFVGSLLNIMLRTDEQIIYDLARNLVENVIANATFSGLSIRIHEINIWMDVIQEDTVDTFCNIFETAQKARIQLETLIQSAKNHLWRTGIEVDLLFSPLVTVSLLALSNEGTLSPEAVRFLCSIVAKLLLVSSNCESLFTIIEYIFKGTKPSRISHKELRSLLLYSNSFAQQRNLAGSTNLCQSIFGAHHFHTVISEIAQSDQKNSKEALNILKSIVSESPSVSIDAYRQCRILVDHSGSNKVAQRLDNVLSYILPFSLQQMNEKNMWDIYDDSQESSRQQLSCLISTCAEIASSNDIYHVDKGKHIEAIVHALYRNKDTIGTRKVCLVKACIVQFVPISVRSFWTESLWSIKQNDDSDSQILFAGILCKSLNLFKAEQLTPLLIEKLCEIWSELLGQIEKRNLIHVESILLKELELKMSESICIPSVNLSILNVILDLTSRSFTENFNYDFDSIAITIIENDVAMIGESVAKCVLKDPEISSFALKRYTIASSIIRQIAAQRQLYLQSYDWYFQLLRFISNGLTKIMNLLNKEDRIGYDIRSKIIDAIEVAWATIEQHQEISDGVLESLDTILENSMNLKRRDVNKPFEMAILSLLLHIFSRNSLKTGMERLQVITMQYIIKMLPRSVKENELEVLGHMERIITVILDNFQASSNELDRLLAVSLKLGISDVGDGHSCLCIKVAKQIVSASASVKQSDALNAFSPAQVHDMILTHSKFKNVMENDTSTRKELIHLMAYCVSLSNGLISPPENDKINLLLLKYRGSVCKADQLLRLLLHSYELRQEIKPFMHSLKFGPNQTTNFPENNFDLLGTDHVQHFEWFIECLDVQRVRKTISDFPVNDTLEPSLLLLPNIDGIQPHQNETAENISLNTQDSDSSSFYSSSDDDTDDFSDTDKVHAMNSVWEAPDDDDRYSPGAILPYILAILETFEYVQFNDNSSVAPDLEPEHGVDEPKIDMNGLKRETFVKVAYRLFQKGAVALVLSCLASKCANIRKLSVSILGKFLKASKMEESQTISSWKSRSQVEMALDAIQRGLMVARARKMKDTETSSEHGFVPLLPNVSALFLSRALFVLNKPGDDMYPAINKYFLRLDDHHGAYSDCFSLPIFMALFCSMNENDENIAKKERCFALQLLKDGTIDDLCYKVASKRHVPELLLTALSSFLSKSDFIDEYECFLILGAIEKLVINGGDATYRHYFKSVGLVPWIQTTIHSCLSKEYFQSSSLLNVMVRLFRITLEKYHSFLQKEDDNDLCLITLDSAGILLLLGNIHRSHLSCKKSIPTRNNLSVNEEIAKIICSIHDIEMIRQRGQSLSYPYPIVQPCGFQIQMALALIESKEIDAKDGAMDKIITVFSKFPLSADFSNPEDKNGVVMLCIAWIKSISNSFTHRIDTLDVPILVLQRISLLGPMISTTDVSYSNLLDNLLAFRSHAIKDNSLRKIWMECLWIMVKSLDANTDMSKKYLQLMGLLDRLERDTVSKAILSK